MAKLSPIVNKRPVFLLSHGASIKGLEDRIQEYKDKDICWVGMGLFTNMEKYILSKIGKKLDVVFDCASVPDGFRRNYETNVRMPRLKEFLERPEDNRWICTHGTQRDCIDIYAPEMRRFDNKIFLVDSLFPKHQIGLWMSVPNSTTLAIASMIAGGASKIFIFGMDGHTKSDDNVNTYYHPEEHEKERLAALGSTKDNGIPRDTDNFRKQFPVLLRNYYRLFGRNTPIYNVSPITVYDCPPKIKYEEIRNYL